jgi:hypothetical protein
MGAKLQAVRLVPEYVVGPRTFKIKVGNSYTIFGVPSRAYNFKHSSVRLSQGLAWLEAFIRIRGASTQLSRDVDAHHKRKMLPSGQQQVVDIISRLDLHSPQSSRATSSWPLIILPHGFKGIAEGKWLCHAHTIIGARVGIKTISFLHMSHSQAHNSSVLHNV